MRRIEFSFVVIAIFFSDFATFTSCLRAFCFSNMEDLNILRDLDFLEGLESRKSRASKKRKNFFTELTDKEFHKRFRLEKSTTLEVCDMISNNLEPPSYTNNALYPIEQLLIALRFYATGSFQLTIADLAEVSQATASRVIHRVSKQLALLNREFITFPSTAEDCRKVAEGFFGIAQFPGVIGTIDCTHVRIASPGGDDAERFRCRKGFFSINVQTIISSDLVIEHVVARWPGSTHDSTIFNNSSIIGNLQSSTVLRKHHVLGDSGYANQPCMLTPVNPATPADERYNKSHILTRNTVERKYGVMKRRFPCLRLGLNCHINNVPAIIVACCVLHNLAVKFKNFEDSLNCLVLQVARCPTPNRSGELIERVWNYMQKNCDAFGGYAKNEFLNVGGVVTASIWKR